MIETPTFLTSTEVIQLGYNPDDYEIAGWYFPDCRFRKTQGEPLYSSSSLGMTND